MGYAIRLAAVRAARRLDVSDVEGASLSVEEIDGRFYVMLSFAAEENN